MENTNLLKFEGNINNLNLLKNNNKLNDYLENSPIQADKNNCYIKSLCCALKSLNSLKNINNMLFKYIKIFGDNYNYITYDVDNNYIEYNEYQYNAFLTRLGKLLTDKQNNIGDLSASYNNIFIVMKSYIYYYNIDKQYLNNIKQYLNDNKNENIETLLYNKYDGCNKTEQFFLFLYLNNYPSMKNEYLNKESNIIKYTLSDYFCMLIKNIKPKPELLVSNMLHITYDNFIYRKILQDYKNKTNMNFVDNYIYNYIYNNSNFTILRFSKVCVIRVNFYISADYDKYPEINTIHFIPNKDFKLKAVIYQPFDYVLNDKNKKTNILSSTMNSHFICISNQETYYYKINNNMHYKINDIYYDSNIPMYALLLFYEQ